MSPVRSATPADVAEIHAMVVELAEYERDPDAVRATPADLHAALFGPRPVAEAIIAEPAPSHRPAGAPAIAGHAVFYETFSTWEGRPGIWLEDLYVRPAYRGTGLGAALFSHLARLVIAREGARLEWVALDWNTPALDFYERFGARRYGQWPLHRLSGAALDAAAEPHRPGK
ncbi:GNAT family N-acetyltransferase [Conexibacter sp. DBS9H8]|uniref:GNAT family N-acetyltransferase n=1 Tax=Conexibacter sp. DBS9H8 TaxID=2937801 RepID=UPI00200D122D|nr:GNAT family N-acetyltransferase [Conexibacter sp. DBS9H8]